MKHTLRKFSLAGILLTLCTTAHAQLHPITIVRAGATINLCQNALLYTVITGGIIPFTYTWTHGAITKIDSNIAADSTNTTISPYNASDTGTWVYTVYDHFGDTARTTYFVSGGSLPSVSITPSSAMMCPGGAGVTLTAFATTDSALWAHYTWSPAGSLSKDTGVSVVATPSITTTYTVVDTNSYGCIGTATVTVTIDTLPNVYILPTGPIYICTTGSDSLFAYPNSGSCSYKWEKSTGTISGATNEYYIAHTSDAWWVKVIVTDGHGCVDSSARDSIISGGTPTITVSNDTTLCPRSSDSLKASGANTGGTYAWSPSTGLSASTGAGVVVSVGAPTLVTTTYTVTGTTEGGCHSTATVTVVVPTDTLCCPDSTFKGQPFHTITKNITSSLPPGNYYCANTITVIKNLSSLSADSAIMEMAPAIRVYIDSATKLTLTGSHLFGCPDSMWQGLTFNASWYWGKTHSPQLYMNGNTMIEDANKAVDIEYDYAIPPTFNPFDTTFASSAWSLFCDGAIFNKNITGIYFYLDNPSPYTSADSILPYEIRNSVFTSRSFSNYNNSATVTLDYPFAWPATIGGTGALKNSWSPGSNYLPPYNIDNPTASLSGMPYPFTLCKAGYSTNHAAYGVYNNSTGNYSSGIFYDETVGDYSSQDMANTFMNLFDSLEYGVFSSGGNNTVYNSTFMHIYYLSALTNTGSGIYSSGANTRLRAIEKGVGIDQFYGCVNGVYTNLCLQTIVDSTLIISNHNITTDIDLGDTKIGCYGIRVASPTYSLVQLNNNNIYNIENGIVMSTSGTGSGTAGNVIINSDTLSCCFAWDALSTRFMTNAIDVLQPVEKPGETGEIIVDSNFIRTAFCGIEITGYESMSSVVLNNYITLAKGPDTLLAPGGMQYGIYETNCIVDSIVNNTVTGAGPDVPTHSTNLGGQQIVGILAGDLYGPTSGVTTTLIACNDVNNVNEGFMFEFDNTSLQWANNKMSYCYYGFVLDGGTAVIGSQVNANTPSNNQWEGTTWSITAPYQTYVVNANALNSILYVYNTGSPYQPTDNGFYGSVNAYSTITGSLVEGSVISYADLPYSCSTYGSDMRVMESAAIDTPSRKTLTQRHNEQVAQNNVTYYADVKIDEWMAQMKLWKTLQMKPYLEDSSVVLQKFDEMATSSRYAYLTGIEDDIAAGNLSDAQTKIGAYTDAKATTATDATTGVQIADDTEANYIVHNYLNFYSLYIKYLNGDMTAADSSVVATLANLCPLANGMAVYKARSLYAVMYVPQLYKDDCPVTIDSTAARKANKGNTEINEITQQYALYPNPNDGNFTVMQKIADNEPVNTTIWNATGQRIYQGALQFTNAASKLGLGNLAQGLYLLQLTDEKGRTFTFKFVIQ